MSKSDIMIKKENVDRMIKRTIAKKRLKKKKQTPEQRKTAIYKATKAIGLKFRASKVKKDMIDRTIFKRKEIKIESVIYLGAVLEYLGVFPCSYLCVIYLN